MSIKLAKKLAPAKSANPPARIESLKDLFDVLALSRPASGQLNMYRGHPDKAYRLQPSLFRKNEYRRREKHILHELVAIQPNEFRDDRTSFEQLVRMQHYGLPTRLLDVTYNPLVALYFACEKKEKKIKRKVGKYEVEDTVERDGELIIFTLKKSSVKYFDSDVISCVANLCSLTSTQRNLIRKFKTSSQLNKSVVGRRLLHFIKAEKPYFLPIIKLTDLRKIFAVAPKLSNARILAQQGAFFIFGFRSVMGDREPGISVHRTLIPASAKAGLIEELAAININAGALFPELESASKYIMSKIALDADVPEKED